MFKAILDKAKYRKEYEWTFSWYTMFFQILVAIEKEVLMFCPKEVVRASVVSVGM